MAYAFYIDSVLLPVPPEKMTVSIKDNDKTVTLINTGEVNILKKAGLTEFSFDLLLPQVEYSFASYENGFQSADYYLNKLKSLKAGRKPFPFVVTRYLPNGEKLFTTGGDNDISGEFTVSLSDYEIKEDAEELFDLTVSVKLKLYRNYGTKTLTFSSDGTTATAQQTRSTAAKKAETSYTVVSGDTLWSIARRKLGDGSQYTKIYSLNQSTIEAEAKKHGKTSSGNGHWIYPGTVLILPTS